MSFTTRSHRLWRWADYCIVKQRQMLTYSFKEWRILQKQFQFFLILWYERGEKASKYHFVSIANKSISKFSFELLSELRPQKWQNCSSHEGRIECHADLTRWCKKLSKNCPHPQQRLVSSNIPNVCSYHHTFSTFAKDLK